MSKYVLVPNAIKKSWQHEDDPEWWYEQKNNLGPLSFIADNHIRMKEAQEAKRRDQDYYQNTGQTWKNSPYPFLSYSGTWSAQHGYGITDAFEASEKVVSLYSRWWKKW